MDPSDPADSARPADIAVSSRVLVRLERGTSVESMLPGFAAAGLEVERVLTRLRCVTGTVPRDRLEDLRATSGVSGVEPDRTVRTC